MFAAALLALVQAAVPQYNPIDLVERDEPRIGEGSVGAGLVRAC